MLVSTRLAISLLVAFACAFQFVPRSDAQHADSGGKGEGFWQLLKAPMNVPEVPNYTGQTTFVGGLMYPNKKGGPTVSMHYRVRETPDQVIEWYEEALKAYKWVGRKAPVTNKGRSYEAFKGNSSVTISASDCAVKGFRTDLRMSCKIAR
ncbi:MAG: hypothetical protein KIT34_09545 [Cyanobacteria bacterium TGS_CYA1]|nr:hypothetical protein [Cyanobacteria bacterium TGS_CYA1]